MTVWLETPTPRFWEGLVKDHQLENEDRNWRWGFGRGEEGAMKATKAMREARDATDPLVDLLVVRRGVDEVGLFVLRLLPIKRRTLRVLPYLFDEEVGDEALETLCDMLFDVGKDKVFRVETELVTRAKPERSMFKALGFRQEGRRRSSIWMGNNAMDTVLLATTHPEYHRRERLVA